MCYHVLAYVLRQKSVTLRLTIETESLNRREPLETYVGQVSPGAVLYFVAPKEQDCIYDVLFDEEFLGGMTIRCSPNRGYRMPPYALINLSHGERKEYERQAPQGSRKPTAVVKPQTNQYGGNAYSQV